MWWIYEGEVVLGEMARGSKTGWEIHCMEGVISNCRSHSSLGAYNEM